MDITTSILLAVILIVLTFCLYDWLFGSRDYWTSRGIPSVPGVLPVVGNTLSVILLQENLGTFCKTLCETYRDKSMVGFYSLKKPMLMIRDPELVKRIMQTSFNNFQDNKNTLDLEMDPLMGRDPFYNHGQVWKDTRAIFVTILSSRRLKFMSHSVANVCKKLENYLSEKIKNNDFFEFEGKSLYSKYTTEVAASSVIGIDGDSFADDYKGTLLHNMELTIKPTKINALKHNILFFLPALGKFIKARFIPLAVDKYFRRTVKDLEDLRQKDDVARTDALQLLLDMEKSGKILKADVIAHTFSFFLESFETSSLTLSAMSYFIAKHREVQNRLRTEVETVLANHDGQLTYEAINEMSYMQQVMNESSRFLPIAGALIRSCTEACHLEGSDGLTVDVEPGTPVIVPILGLHMDSEIWENPTEFNPERFRKGDGMHKFVHLPFGGGPRVCPGQRYGILQVKGAIATVLKNYRIELSPKMKDPARIDPSFYLITVAGGYWLRLRPLKNN